MGKILSKYENDIDKTWFDSSNILYAECDDKTNQLKEVKIVFKNGGTYKYKDVNITDYLLFREAASTGKAFIKYLKNYEFEKLENSNIDDLKNELSTLIELAQKQQENEENNNS